MGFWIAILITLAVLGSVMWVMPSQREKALTEMRRTAMSLGLKVRLLDPKLAKKFFPWLDDYRGFTLYEKYFSAGQQHARFQVVRLSIDENAHELDLDDPVKLYIDRSGLVNDLPSSVEALLLFAGGVAILWREDEGPEAVTQINECLAHCLQTAALWQSADNDNEGA